DASVPRRVPLDDGGRAGAAGRFDPLPGLADDETLDRLALGVAPRELRGELPGEILVLLFEQRERDPRRVEPAGRVQTRGDPEGDFLGIRRPSRRDAGLGEE